MKGVPTNLCDDCAKTRYTIEGRASETKKVIAEYECKLCQKDLCGKHILAVKVSKIEYRAGGVKMQGITVDAKPLSGGWGNDYVIVKENGGLCKECWETLLKDADTNSPEFSAAMLDLIKSRAMLNKI